MSKKNRPLWKVVRRMKKYVKYCKKLEAAKLKEKDKNDIKRTKR